MDDYDVEVKFFNRENQYPEIYLKFICDNNLQIAIFFNIYDMEDWQMLYESIRKNVRSTLEDSNYEQSCFIEYNNKKILVGLTSKYGHMIKYLKMNESFENTLGIILNELRKYH